MLYPLKFKTVYKEKIWGGEKIRTVLGKDFSPLSNCGETWEISGLEPDSSIVSNGFLADNSLNELVEIYMGDLVGEKLFDRFGNEFPLLIKFIDAQDDLSVQVHPDDRYAEANKLPNGKTEMWYIVDAQAESCINVGFKEPIDRAKLEKIMAEEQLEQNLHYIKVKADDVFFIPAGKVHAIGKGCLIAEIQQCADSTFRLYDYHRKDKQGKERELHIEQALACIDYQDNNNNPVNYQKTKNKTVNLVSCPYFTTNLLDFDACVEKIYAGLDSFVLYICLDGAAKLSGEFGEDFIRKGDCVLLPAIFNEAVLEAIGQCKLLEIYID